MGPRRGISFALVVVAALPWYALVVAEAGAYPQEQNSCTDPSLHWDYQPSSLWTHDKKVWVKEGFDKLSDALDYNGTKLITVPNDGGISVQIQDKPLNMYGSSECVWPTTSLWVNSNYSAQKFYHNVARHEMFHLGGARHGGGGDSFDGVAPTTMSTCLDWQDYTDNVMEQDSHALENWLWSSLDFRQQNANLGFEQGTRFWGKTGGVGWTYYTSGGATGPGHIGWASSNIYEYVYQTVRIINGDDTELDYRAKANAKAPGSAFTLTKAQVELWRRSVDYLNDPQNPNGCDYADGIVNPNGGVSVSGWILMTSSPEVSIGTAWEAFTTSNPTEWVDPPTQEGYDFQVRLHGYAYNPSTGNFGEIRFDNVRDEGRSF
jgi:hypothetical protein